MWSDRDNHVWLWLWSVCDSHLYLWSCVVVEWIGWQKWKADNTYTTHRHLKLSLERNLSYKKTFFYWLFVQDWYAQSFRDLVVYEQSSADDSAALAKFCQCLKTIQTRHTNVVQTMAQGVLELKESHTVDNQTDLAIQYFLDRFYMSRISMRMLIHQVKANCM